MASNSIAAIDFGIIIVYVLMLLGVGYYVYRRETSFEEYLLAGEFARLVEKTPATVRGWADTGRVQVLRTQTGVRLFRRSDVARFVK